MGFTLSQAGSGSLTRPLASSLTRPLVPSEGGSAEPTAPALSDFSAQQTGANTWRDIFWSSTVGTWIEPAHGGDTFSPIVHVWTPTVARSGRVWVRLHPAGGDPDIPPGGSMDIQFLQPALAQGDVVFSGTFPHSGIWVASQGAYQTNDVDVCGKMLQFIRSLHVAFDFEVDNLATMAQSRGNHVLLSAFRANLADPEAPTYAGRRSSIPDRMFHVNSQFAFNTRRAGEESCSDWATESAAFYAFWGAADDTRLCSGDLIATAPVLPPFCTNYDLEWPSITYASADGKVPVATVNASGTNHWPQAGKVFGREYAARGMSDRYMAWANCAAGGDAEQMGYYVVANREMDGGATLQDAMTTAVAVKRGHSAIAARADLAGVWQVNDGLDPPTGSTAAVVGQPVGAIADMAQGIAAAATNPLVGTPGGQTTAAQRTVLATTPGGYGFSVVATQRVLVGYAGTSNDAREGRSWTLDNIRYDVPALLPAGAIGFGTAQANDKTLVLMVAAPLGTPITDQDARVYDHSAYQRRDDWSVYLTEIGSPP